jgi:hypothetical protein
VRKLIAVCETNSGVEANSGVRKLIAVESKLNRRCAETTSGAEANSDAETNSGVRKLIAVCGN